VRIGDVDIQDAQPFRTRDQLRSTRPTTALYAKANSASTRRFSYMAGLASALGGHAIRRERHAR
jgi:hypothetical protein